MAVADVDADEEVPFAAFAIDGSLMFVLDFVVLVPETELAALVVPVSLLLDFSPSARGTARLASTFL